jgi:hypothetical protein
VHEGGVRAVLEHAANEVGQEVGEAADRRIHANGDLALREQRFVERVAHADELLEFEFASLGQLEDRRHRAAVVRRERGVDGVRRRQ